MLRLSRKCLLLSGGRPHPRHFQGCSRNSGGQPCHRYFRGYPKNCRGLPRPQYFGECFRCSSNSAGTPKLQGAPPPLVLPGAPLMLRGAAPPPILPGVPLILQGAALHPPSILPGVLPILRGGRPRESIEGEATPRSPENRRYPEKALMASPTPGASGVQFPSGSTEGGGAPRSFWGKYPRNY